ncbi:MAG: site-specific integrase [Dysgonomonadaceae bacterium]|mgnify:CR=1 FL=1|nr:site-specific integrase [Dysgonamonadaceae bacterium]
MASFRFEINKSRPTRNKTYVIWLRITTDCKRKLVKTPIELNSAKDFNPKARQSNWVRSSEPRSAKWNDELASFLEKAKDTYKDLRQQGVASSENISQKMLASEVSSSFLQYAKQRTNDILNEGGHRNYKKYNGFCNKIDNFLITQRKKDLLFAELTTSFLSKFEAYLHTLKNERNPEAKLHPNTIAINLNIFKTIINRAVEVDKIITPEQNPFLGYKYTREVSTTKEKLNENEINKIEQLELKKNSTIWHCRNYFLFSFYLAGIRAGDLVQLRWRNVTPDGRLEYRMKKTKKDRSLFLHQKARNILSLYYKEETNPNDYIFPLLDNNANYAKAVTPQQIETLPTQELVNLHNAIGAKNALINKYLKKIAKLAEIDKNLSMHIARHSFAKIAKDNKVDNNHLKNLLGHSNIKITETYMGNFDTSETDEVMSSIFKQVNSDKAKLDELINELTPTQIKKLLTHLESNK